MSEPITIRLKRAEALVLFEFLSREGQKEQLTPEHAVERRALCGLLCDLERSLDEPFADDYRVRLSAARMAVADD